MVTVGAVRSGKTSTGIVRPVQMPATSSTSDSTTMSQWCVSDHSMSRFIAPSMDVAFGRKPARVRRELHVVRTASHHALTGGEAAAHADRVAVTRRDLDEPADERLAPELHEHKRTRAFRQHRTPGHDNHRFL